MGDPSVIYVFASVAAYIFVGIIIAFVFSLIYTTGLDLLTMIMFALLLIIFGLAGVNAIVQALQGLW